MESVGKKIALITHVADVDGAFPILLAKFVFSNVDAYSCEFDAVDETFEKVIESDYDFIYITDLNMSEELAEKVNHDECLKNKVLVFDHHESKRALNKYPFISVIVTENNRMECGSSLFYKYLKENYDNELLNKKSLLQILELIRQGDTYDFRDGLKEDAFRLGNLYEIFGREKFIERYYEYILNNSQFTFSNFEKALLEIEEARNKRYIEEKLKNVRKAKINGIPVGIVFAEQNRSLLGNTMARVIPDIDIALVINVDRSVSYRAVKEDVDVNVLAVPCGGGGHKHASGSPLPIDLQKEICESIFDDIIWED